MWQREEHSSSLSLLGHWAGSPPTHCLHHPGMFPVSRALLPWLPHWGGSCCFQLLSDTSRSLFAFTILKDHINNSLDKILS